MNNVLKKIQKETGIKMGNYDNEKNRLYHQGQMILAMLEVHIKEIEINNLYNEQFFIDFEDKLNEYSIKDHNV